jgi:hypothetical protein
MCAASRSIERQKTFPPRGRAMTTQAIRIRLSETSPAVLSYDNEVLECFFIDGSTRIHVIHLKGIELATDGNGKHLLTIQLKYKNLFLPIDEEPFEKVKALIDQVKLAMMPSAS